MKDTKIYRNRARCKKCNDVIDSLDVHHFNTCSCGSLSVDGGYDYIRRVFGNEDDYEELSEYCSKDEFLWGVFDHATGYTRKEKLENLKDSHIQNIALHLRTRYAYREIKNGSPEDYAMRADRHYYDINHILVPHILPELERRGLPEVTEEIPH